MKQYPPGISSLFTYKFLCSSLSVIQLIMSSDKLGSIQQPVVSVDFDLSESGQNRTESVELSKEELEQLISSLEAANKVT